MRDKKGLVAGVKLATRTKCTCIRESVDSLCRDGADTPAPMPPYIGKAFTRTNFEDLRLFRYMMIKSWFASDSLPNDTSKVAKIHRYSYTRKSV